MAEAEPHDPVPPLAREVAQLFTESLAEQRFGDLDASTLDALAQSARDLAREVDAARAVLDDARAQLDEARAELVRRAEQALAYARVYAAEDPALRERLDRIEAARPDPSAGKKRRGRPRKASAAKATGSQLPFEEARAAS